MNIDEAYPEHAVTDPLARAAERNVWLSWTVAKSNEVDAYRNNVTHWDRGAFPVTEHQAWSAIAAAERLERAAADLRAIAARRITPLEIVENAA